MFVIRHLLLAVEAVGHANAIFVLVLVRLSARIGGYR